MMALGLFALGNCLQLVVVDQLRVAPHVVKRRPVKLAAETEPMSVGQVAAVRQIQAQNGIARLQHRRVGRGVGLRAGVRLHVDVLSAKNLLRTVSRQVLHNIAELAATVVAPAWIALGVLVGKDRAGRFQYCFGDKVLAGNHLQPFVLAEGFLVKSSRHIWVGLGKGEGHASVM